MTSNRHLTTRRSFIAAAGFGGVSLYGLWVVYGAAPGPLALLGMGDAHPAGGDDSHDAHGGGGGGPAVDEFRRLTEAFVEEYRMADGSVYPSRLAARPGRAVDAGMTTVESAPVSHGGAADMHGSHDMMAAASGPASHGGAADSHGSHDMTAPSGDGGHQPGNPAHGDGLAAAGAAPLDVYLLAEKWSFEPALLRLDAGVPYRFRMMATDVSHGASIQFGRGGRMIRLRPNSLAEMEATFTKPGSYLVHCTVYCGQAHDFMQARIDVV